MPTYDYKCESGHRTEARRGYGVDSIPCPACGLPAARVRVYLEQSIITETGVKQGRRSPIPIDERRYNVSQFQEAAQETAHIYEKQGLENPDLYKQGVRKASEVLAGRAPPPKGVYK